MRHASFFSGAGGLDLGFERAGITTVSVSEIDPYANAVLAERFPGAPNLGSITEVDANDIPEADIWSGGFPCQDLSVAGKRAGFGGERSSLAFKFLNLVEQRRPRWLVLENVPGLLSSNQGRDFARLIHEMDELRYGVSWRTLDARHFRIAQRRRRVFLVASLESERASEILLECRGCKRHPDPRWEEGQGVAGNSASSAHISGGPTGTSQPGQAADADGVRAADGLARRLDNQRLLEDSQRVGNFELYDFPTDSVAPSLNARRARDLMAYGGESQKVFRKAGRAQHSEDAETWVEGEVANTLNSFDVGDIRTTHAIVGGTQEEDNLLPIGLDGHRYRLCGNGVVAPVAEWIGRRIVEADRRWRQEEAK